MAKAKLRKYELIYLVQPEATDEERERIADRVDQILQDFQAKVLLKEDWGKRKLAYEIQKHNKAYYVYVVFISAPGATHEIERVLRMLDNCIRYMHIKLEEGIDPDNLERYEEVPRIVPRGRIDLDDDDDDDDDEDDVYA